MPFRFLNKNWRGKGERKKKKKGQAGLRSRQLQLRKKIKLNNMIYASVFLEPQLGRKVLFIGV